MKRTLSSVLLLVLSVSAQTQQRTVSVRLFWQHPPTSIRVAPEDATLAGCDKCPNTRLTAPIEISANGASVHVGGTASPQVLLTGRARISGDGFPSFLVKNELTIQARDDLLLVTLKMPLEQYTVAVLQGESASFKSSEALKAMAVAARTYALHFGSRHQLEGFDYCDTTHCQDLRLGNESPHVRAAVAATPGEFLWFQGRPAATYYHRSCGGELENASTLDPDLRAPYLRRHHDDFCAKNPDEWQAQISKADLTRVLGHPVHTVAVSARSDSGRVQRLLIDGRPMNATDFR